MYASLGWQRSDGDPGHEATREVESRKLARLEGTRTESRDPPCEPAHARLEQGRTLIKDVRRTIACRQGVTLASTTPQQPTLPIGDGSCKDRGGIPRAAAEEVEEIGGNADWARGRAAGGGHRNRQSLLLLSFPPRANAGAGPVPNDHHGLITTLKTHNAHRRKNVGKAHGLSSSEPALGRRQDEHNIPIFIAERLCLVAAVVFNMLGSWSLGNVPNDRSGLIVVFAAVGVCWSLTVLVTRLSGSIFRRRVLTLGDWSIVASTASRSLSVDDAFGVASSVAIFVGVNSGLGRANISNARGDEDSIAKALYATDILYILALTFSKLATLQMITALSPMTGHKRACYTLAALIVAWAVSATLAVSLRCNITAPWSSWPMGRCSDMFYRWTVLESIGLVIECLIFSIAAMMIRILRTRREHKAKAMLAFAVRLPVIIPTALRLRYLHTTSLPPSPDWPLLTTAAVIATQCTVHFSVMSASFSYLRPFLAAFDSNLGASTRLDTLVASRSGGDRSGGDRSRKDGSGVSSGRWRSPVAKAVGSAAPSEAGGEVVSLPQPQQRQNGGRDGSADSKAPIIVKTTSYRVEHEA